MTFLFSRRFAIVFFLSVSFLLFLPPAFCAAEENPAVRAVDQVLARLEAGEEPQKIFTSLHADIPRNEARAAWINPREWIGADGVNGYVGTLVYAYIEAPFHKISQIIKAYTDAPKYIPGVIETNIISRKREAANQESVLVERKREIPVALRALKPASNRYYLQYELKWKEDSWLGIRVHLANHGRKKSKGALMKVIEAVEYIRKLDDRTVFYVSFGFALPDTGFIPVEKAEKQDNQNGANKLIKSVTFGFSDKIAATLDVGSRLYDSITQSILDGTYQTASSLIQVTTDQRWKNKWPHQMSAKDTEELFKENKALLEHAKKNNWIEYQQI